MTILDSVDPLMDAIPAEESIEWSSTGRLTWVVYLNFSVWLTGIIFFALGLGGLLFFMKQIIKKGISHDLSFFIITTLAFLVTTLGGWSILRQTWLQWQDIRFTRCIATPVKLYIWRPSQGLQVTRWQSLPTLQAQFFATGVFSLYYEVNGRSSYLFKHVIGDAAALQHLNNLRWRALETYL